MFKALRRIIYSIVAAFNHKDTKAVVLTYHAIGNDNWEHGITLQNFKQQIDYVSYKLKYLPLSSISALIKGTYQSSVPTFTLTFDDGYKDVLQVKEYLKAKNIKPTLFLIADTKNADINQITNREFLNVEEVKSLIADGWEIGSHGMTHKDFWTLNDAEMTHEIVESKKLLEETYGVPVKYFSYPRGRYNDKIVAQVKSAGYEMAVSMEDDVLQKGTNIYLVPRVGISRSHTFSEFKQTITEPVILFRKFIKNFAGGVFRKFI